MTTYTIIDATGEIKSKVDVPDAAHLESNTPTGCTALPGEPPVWNAFYRNAQWVEKPVQPLPTSTWNVTTKEWEDLRTLDQIKADARAALGMSCDQVLDAGFTWSGSAFDSNADSRAAIQLQVFAAQADSSFSITWTLADNTTRLLSAADMIAVGQALATFVQGVVAKLQSLQATIAAATTSTQVAAVAWS